MGHTPLLPPHCRREKGAKGNRLLAPTLALSHLEGGW